MNDAFWDWWDRHGWKVVVGLGVALIVLAAVSCTNDGSAPVDISVQPHWDERIITLEDGRQIDCIYQSVGETASLSCDWGAAR